MARQCKRAPHPGQRQQVLLLSLGFSHGNKAKCFCLARQITLGIDASAFPLLKAVGHGDGMEMPRAVCLAPAAEWR